MNIWKRITSCVVCAGLLLLLAPVNGAARIAEMSLSVHAQESGTCGRNLTWTLDDAGILTISGMMGEILGLPSDLKSRIKAVVIKPGVINIGNAAFSDCTNLTSVTIPDSVTQIDGLAFSGCTSLTSVTILNPKCEIADYSFTFSNGDYSNNYPFTGTIYGYEGSTAQAYAEKYGRKFEVISGTPSTSTPTTPAPQVEAYSTGDVTGDSIINAKDASAVLIAAAKIGTGKTSGLIYEAGIAADVNGDGTINAKDANTILRYAAAVGTGKAGNIKDFI